MWNFSDKFFRMGLVGRKKDPASLFLKLTGLSTMDPVRGHKPNTRVAMIKVIPVKEVLTEGPGILNTPKAVREPGSIFQGLELGLGKGVVVGDMGAAEVFGDPQIRQELGHPLGGHGAAAIRMDGQRIGANILFTTAFLNQTLGQKGRPTTYRLKISRMT